MEAVVPSWGGQEVADGVVIDFIVRPLLSVYGVLTPTKCMLETVDQLDVSSLGHREPSLRVAIRYDDNMVGPEADIDMDG